MNSIYTELCSIFLLLFVLADYYTKYSGKIKYKSFLWIVFCLSILMLSIINIFNYIGVLTFVSNIIVIIPIIIHLIHIDKNYILKDKSILNIRYLIVYFVLYMLTTVYFISGNYFNNVILYILTIIPLIYFVTKVIANRITFEKRIYYLILFPSLGGLIDILFNTQGFLTFFYSLSALFSYIFMHDMAINRDSLTGANNRRYLDSYVYSSDKKYAVYMIDIDDFKKTNDTYGHDKGDNVLVDLVEILKSSVRTTDSVIRTGGDEFVIIAAMKNDNDIKVIYNRINDNIKKHNQQNKIKISISIGYDLYSSHLDFNVFLDNIDKKMYRSKKAKKRNYEKENN